jgi:putative sterol carrier protein
MNPKEILEQKIPEKVKAKPEVGKAINAPVVFDLSGDGGGQWTLDFSTENCEVRTGSTDDAKVTLCMTAEDFVSMIDGELNAQKAFLTGKLKVKGDMGAALKLGQLLS